MKTTTSGDELSVQIEEVVRAHIAKCRRTAEEALRRAFGSSGELSAGPRRVVRAGAAAGTRRRSSGEMASLSERLYAALCAHPGASMAELSTHVTVPVRELHRPMAQLKETGRVRSVGQRSMMRYFPMKSSKGAASG